MRPSDAEKAIRRVARDRHRRFGRSSRRPAEVNYVRFLHDVVSSWPKADAPPGEYGPDERKALEAHLRDERPALPCNPECSHRRWRCLARVRTMPPGKSRLAFVADVGPQDVILVLGCEFCDQLRWVEPSERLPEGLGGDISGWFCSIVYGPCDPADDEHV